MRGRLFVMTLGDLNKLNERITNCCACQRLRAYCHEIGIKKRRAYLEDSYWAQPVPNFGDPQARLLIVGLAPGAHGANRTGRMFTGDRSGDWLYRALYRAGFCNQPNSVSLDDGLQLRDCYITAVCHCAPPGNKPLREEQEACQPFLESTVKLVAPRVILCLGQMAWSAVLQLGRRSGWLPKSTGRLKFAHGRIVGIHTEFQMVASYHPSQQNTFTKKLTEEMFDAVLADIRKLMDSIVHSNVRATAGSTPWVD